MPRKPSTGSVLAMATGAAIAIGDRMGALVATTIPACIAGMASGRGSIAIITEADVVAGLMVADCGQ